MYAKKLLIISLTTAISSLTLVFINEKGIYNVSIGLLLFVTYLTVFFQYKHSKKV